MPVASKDKLYKSKSTGQWYKADPTVTTGDRPGFRLATPKEISEYEAGPISIVEGDALSLGKRFKVVNFATNADELTEFLRTGEPHLVVKKYGGRPHDLAVSQDGGKTYKLIDPAPKRYAITQAMRASGNLTAPVLAEAAMAMVTDPVEFGKDILDIAYDTLAGIATAKATAAGVVAGPVTGAAAGGGMELLRQKIGQGMGVSKRLDPLALGVAGAAGAVMPTASSAVRVLRKGQPLVEESAAFLTGAKGDTGIPATDVLKKRIRVGTPARAKVSDIENDASALRRTIAQVKETDFPEKEIANAMEEAAGETVNFMDLIEPLSKAARDEGKVLADSSLPSDATDLIDWTYRMIKESGVVDSMGLGPDPTKVPVPVARRIKDAIWAALPEATFNGKPVSNAYRAELKAFGGRISEATRQAVDSSVDPAAHGTHLTYSQLMDKMKSKMDQLDYWQQASGVWEYKTKELADGTVVTLSDKIPLDEAKGTAKMVEFGTNLWGKNRHFIERAVEQFRQDFGIDMREALEKMAISQKIGMKGAGGAMQMRPHITSVGGVPMTGAIGGALMAAGGGAGYLASGGNPLVTALAALGAPAVAGTLASPAFIVGAGRSAVGPALGAAGRAVEGAAASQAGRASAVMSLNEAVSQMRQRSGGPYPGQNVRVDAPVPGTPIPTGPASGSPMPTYMDVNHPANRARREYLRRTYGIEAVGP